MTHDSIDNKSYSSLIDLEFPPSFFNDEIREGFYIPEMMKRFWAAQLKVLSEIAKICEKHDIPWVADYGSLIGAVRHGGYIPWDDDFDICMLRHDYENFLKYAKTELPEGYLSLDIREIEESDNQNGRIVNWNRVPSDNDKLIKYYGCPYGVGIDIFPLDGVADDPEKEEKRVRLAKEIGQALRLLVEGKKETSECRKILANIERENHVILHRKKDLRRQLNLLALDLYRMYPSETSEKVAFMPLWVNHNNNIFPKKYFEKYIWSKFETTEIKISVLYEEMIKSIYGDYMKINRAGGAHDYPVYGGQEETLKESFGRRNPGRYTFIDEVLSKVIGSGHNDDSQSKALGRIDFSSYCDEVIGLMKTVGQNMLDLFASEDYGTLYQVLEECQSLAISLGSEVEKRIKNSNDIIGLLEKYCELVYVCHEKLAEGILQKEEIIDISNLVLNIESTLYDAITNRKKRVLFLPCSPKWWRSMEDIYFDRLKDTQNECRVVPIPCYQKDLDEKIIGIVEDDDKYPSDIIMKTLDELGIDDTSLYDKLWSALDFEKNYYDEIVIQFPFDGWNRSMTIPPQFCSDELIKHTDLLTYSPCLVPVFPEGGDAKLYTSLKTLVEQPTVIYSDTVILHSQQEKEAYQSIADELTGGKYTRYWNEKFSVINTGEDKKSISDNSACEQNKAIDRDKRMDELGLPGDFRDKKILLYHMGISSLLENKYCAVERLKETVSDITENQDRIKCIFSPGKNVCELEHIDPDLWTKYKAFIDELSQDDRIYLDDKGDALAYIDIVDGYYGDGDVVAHRCRNKGIPVMIRKADMG